MTAASGAGSVRVIGVGSRWRCDDAAGLVAARRIRELAPGGVAVSELEGEPISLLDLWEDTGAALVIDAVSSGSAPGTVHRVDAYAHRLPEPLAGSSTHTLGLAEAIELARALDRLPARLIVYGIEGERFEAGDALTAAVESGVEKAVAAVMDELEARHGAPLTQPPRTRART
jgi:hydrogenase maturation protease